MNELLSSGIEIMLLGMLIVFGFLALLVLIIGGMSVFVQRFFPDMPGQLALGQFHEDPGVIAAITAAVHQYRKKYPKQ
jgi:oxaloacetate decarboxylase gamma subunit